jgi:hypothetical protein
MFFSDFYNTAQNGNCANATSSSQEGFSVAAEPLSVEEASQFDEWLNQPEGGPSSYA